MLGVLSTQMLVKKFKTAYLGESQNQLSCLYFSWGYFKSWKKLNLRPDKQKLLANGSIPLVNK